MKKKYSEDRYLIATTTPVMTNNTNTTQPIEGGRYLIPFELIVRPMIVHVFNLVAIIAYRPSIERQVKLLGGP